MITKTEANATIAREVIVFATKNNVQVTSMLVDEIFNACDNASEYLRDCAQIADFRNVVRLSQRAR